jgi:DNA-binding ferritin-like protein
LKKIYTIIIALIVLCGGFYALVRFAEFDPSEVLDELFPKSAAKEEVYGAATPEKLQQLHDSLEILNFVILKETDERLLKNLKETQKYLWDRISSTRNAISKANDPKTVVEEESTLIDSLIKGISITAAILLTIIIFLIIKISRRAKEVEKVTEKLKNLQTEPVHPPLGGLDRTQFATQFRPLPQVKPIETYAPPTPVPEPPKLRKTTKQRVTEAVQRMAKALENLRKDRTLKTQALDVTNAGPIATGDKMTKRVISPNTGDETTFDRRSREKKQILDYARQGRTPSEIAKWLNLPRDMVETVIRLAREKGEI